MSLADLPRPYTATLRTLCGCTREIGELRILWPEYRVPLAPVFATDLDVRYDMQSAAERVRHRVFTLDRYQASPAGTHATYVETDTRP